MASKTSGKKVMGNQFDPGIYNEILVKEDVSLKWQLIWSQHFFVKVCSPF